MLKGKGKFFKKIIYESIRNFNDKTLVKENLIRYPTPTSNQSIWDLKAITVRIPSFLWKLPSVLKRMKESRAKSEQHRLEELNCVEHHTSRPTAEPC